MVSANKKYVSVLPNPTPNPNPVMLTRNSPTPGQTAAAVYLGTAKAPPFLATLDDSCQSSQTPIPMAKSHNPDARPAQLSCSHNPEVDFLGIGAQFGGKVEKQSYPQRLFS